MFQLKTYPISAFLWLMMDQKNAPIPEIFNPPKIQCLFVLLRHQKNQIQAKNEGKSISLKMP